MVGLRADLVAALQSFAAVPRIVVASDFDGCLAPIVSHPADARPDPAAVAALVELAALRDTTVAIVSGRARADLASLAALPDSSVTLIGSHGSEFDDGFTSPVTDEQRALLATVTDELSAISARFPGTMVETKPASSVLHVRNAADAESAERALDQARRGPATHAGVHATEGKAVLELAVIDTGKGHALDLLRERGGAEAVCYLGDDVTDENAFRHLTGPGDVGIKVGDGDTVAGHRIAGPELVGAVLRTILVERSTAL
ncbi:trehalose-phosphatase [Gordonia sp. (in: high G+C Gram-positive bacteria)]|uniref:trehalose-phosphatase n=1 Tax=Gordonia sp. (in: high G+C Gram-positive bacteria) TaxID=84139 RepID=UPI0039E647BC